MKEEITKEVTKYFELNESKNTMYQHLWDTGKTMQRGKFIVIHAYIRRVSE